MNIRTFLYGEYTFEQERDWKKKREEIIMQNHERKEQEPQ